MSRSYKKHPGSGISKAVSEKQDKKIWHSRMRSKTRDLLSNADEDTMFPFEEDVSNPWAMAKDGRQYWDEYKNPRKMTEKEKARKSKQELRDSYAPYSK